LLKKYLFIYLQQFHQELLMEQIPSQTSLVITDGNYMLLFSLDITNIIFLVSNSIAIYNFLEITQCYSSGNFFPFFHVNSLLFYYIIQKTKSNWNCQRSKASHKNINFVKTVRCHH
jgi:hypothetical protein